MLPWLCTCICKLHFPHFNSIALFPFMYTSPCAAPVPHSPPVLTSTNPHEPTVKQQTTEPSHCQSKFFCHSFVKPCCVAKLLHAKACIKRHSILACTYLQDIQAYLLVKFSLHQSMYPFMHLVQPLSPTLHQWWVNRTPWPSSLQQGHHIISVSVTSISIHLWILLAFACHGTDNIPPELFDIANITVARSNGRIWWLENSLSTSKMIDRVHYW